MNASARTLGRVSRDRPDPHGVRLLAAAFAVFVAATTLAVAPERTGQNADDLLAFALHVLLLLAATFAGTLALVVGVVVVARPVHDSPAPERRVGEWARAGALVLVVLLAVTAAAVGPDLLVVVPTFLALAAGELAAVAAGRAGRASVQGAVRPWPRRRGGRTGPAGSQRRRTAVGALLVTSVSVVLLATVLSPGT